MNRFFFSFKSLLSGKKCHLVKYKKKNNKVIIHLKNGQTVINPFLVPDIKVRFKGKNNTIELFEPYSLEKSSFYLGNGDYFILKHVQGNIRVQGGYKSFLFIDEDSTLQNTKIYLNSEKNVSCKIGKDCMFSNDVVIWASDTHQIWDIKERSLLNQSQYGVEIGNHVWCGTRVTILKDSKIPSHSVVGAGSVVTNRFQDEHIIIAGNPAKIIKKNITWKRDEILIE